MMRIFGATNKKLKMIFQIRCNHHRYFSNLSNLKEKKEREKAKKHLEIT